MPFKLREKLGGMGMAINRPKGGVQRRSRDGGFVPHDRASPKKWGRPDTLGRPSMNTTIDFLTLRNTYFDDVGFSSESLSAGA